ncbi:MAG: hypothetical protein WBC78_05940 [Candidatus Sulfotelmatobacter sp.]
MFSTFPHGWPAAGLLLLRSAAGVVLIIQGASSFGSKYESGFPFLGVALLTITVGALLLIGFLTRFAGALAVLAAVGSMFLRFPTPSAGFPKTGLFETGLFETGLFETGLFETRIIAGLVVVIAVAVVCLGPGVFSVDARLFGRREIIIPKNRDDCES